MKIFIITTFIFFMSSAILSVLYLNKTNCSKSGKKDYSKCPANDCPKCPVNDCSKCPVNDCSKCTTNGWTQENKDELDADILSYSSKHASSENVVGCAGQYNNDKVLCETLSKDQKMRDCIINDFTQNMHYNVYKNLKTQNPEIDLMKYMTKQDCQFTDPHSLNQNYGSCYKFNCP